MHEARRLPCGCAASVRRPCGLRVSQSGSTARHMTAAAETFVEHAVRRAAGAKPCCAYDAPVRTDWHYIPKPSRKGLQVKEMNDAQRQGGAACCTARLCAVGYSKATKIMQLESILRELEKSRTRRTDSRSRALLLHAVWRAGRRRPLGLERRGASPVAELRGRRRPGRRRRRPRFSAPTRACCWPTTAPGFPRGCACWPRKKSWPSSCSSRSRPSSARRRSSPTRRPSDVRDAGKAAPPTSAAEGLAARDMTPEQVAILRALDRRYANNLPADVAAERLAAIEHGGYDDITLPGPGADKPGVGHHYLVQGSDVPDRVQQHPARLGRQSGQSHPQRVARPGREFRDPGSKPRQAIDLRGVLDDVEQRIEAAWAQVLVAQRAGRPVAEDAFGTSHHLLRSLARNPLPILIDPRTGF